MTCNFRVGQKVVCVDDSDQGFNGLKSVFVGNVYTVCWVGEFVHPVNEETLLCVRLVGVDRFDPILECDVPLKVQRFRPVVQRKTDISIFKALLTPSKEKVETAS